VPLNAGSLVVSQVTSTALQEHQCRSQERGFDDGEHAPTPLNKIPMAAHAAGPRVFPPTVEYDDPQKPGENVAN
jgi:hypothetical protein